MDTVVTRCRGREIDKKKCRGRDIRRRKRTAARWRRETDKEVCLFFLYIGAACVQYTSFLLFFNFFFITKLKLGLKLSRSELALDHRARLGSSDPVPAPSEASSRSTAEHVWGRARGANRSCLVFFFLKTSDRCRDCWLNAIGSGNSI
jgi:hypothetical protein